MQPLEPGSVVAGRGRRADSIALRTSVPPYRTSIASLPLSRKVELI